MNHLKDILHRLRSGESERRIARDLQVSRPTVQKYYELAKRNGFLDAEQPMPDQATLLAALGPGPKPPIMGPAWNRTERWSKRCSNRVCCYQ
jgi:DNA-binding transcriptional MocR family regulator